MDKKLVKHGNSQAIIIDKPILKLLGIDNETVLEIKIKGNTLLIKPKKPKKEKKRIVSNDKKTQADYEKIIKEYNDLFEKLAKN